MKKIFLLILFSLATSVFVAAPPPAHAQVCDLSWNFATNLGTWGATGFVQQGGVMRFEPGIVTDGATTLTRSEILSGLGLPMSSTIATNEITIQWLQEKSDAVSYVQFVYNDGVGVQTPFVYSGLKGEIAEGGKYL